MALLNFLKPKNQLEEGGQTSAPVQRDSGEPEKKCPNCHREIPLSRLWANDLVCPCGYHFRMKARQRIQMITDKGSFRELYSNMKATKSWLSLSKNDCSFIPLQSLSTKLNNLFMFELIEELM